MHQTFGTLVQFGVQLYERHLFFFYYRRIKLFLILLHDSLRNITDAIFTQHILNRLLANRAFKLFFFLGFFITVFITFTLVAGIIIVFLVCATRSRVACHLRTAMTAKQLTAKQPFHFGRFHSPTPFCRFIPLLAFVI